MTPLPKRRLSTMRQGRRRQAFKLTAASLTTCKNCGQPSYSHKVCAACGYYNGKQVKTIKVKKEKETKKSA